MLRKVLNAKVSMGTMAAREYLMPGSVYWKDVQCLPKNSYLRSAKQGSPLGQFFLVASKAEQALHGKVSEMTGSQI